MFLDRSTLKLIAGSGGNGAVAWRREKYIPKGGPAGGDGGNGGSVSIQADRNLFSLEHFRNKRLIKSKNGVPGAGARKKGKNGPDITLKIPLGTLIKDARTKEILYDFIEDGQTVTLCQGGKGGKGNASFATPTNRAPMNFTEGKNGQSIEIEFELKLIADVGFVGLPNAGKSTLLTSLTHVPVKIAPYPFTTLRPNLGIIEFDDYSKILIADIPGIIQDAHENKGLGLAFLKHIERTSVLVYVIDISAFEGRDPLQDYHILKEELKKHNPALLEKPSMIALNQVDRTDENVQKFIENHPNDVYPISGLEKKGLAPFLNKLKSLSQRDGKRFY